MEQGRLARWFQIQVAAAFGAALLGGFHMLQIRQGTVGQTPGSQHDVRFFHGTENLLDSVNVSDVFGH